MNKFIKLPLFLGLTCLIGGGLLAGVVYLTDGPIEEAKIKKLQEGYRNMYNVDEVETTDVELGDAANKTLLGLTIVKHNDTKSAVYKLSSTSGYETMTFYLGISFDTNTVDGYYNLDTSSQSLGYSHYKDNKDISNRLDGYDGKGSFVVSGVTYTSNAVKEAISVAFNDYNARTWEF